MSASTIMSPKGCWARSTPSRRPTGEKKINALGYCIGGTLLATTLAYMAPKRDKRIASATFLTSLLDFSDVGDLSVFIDEDQLR